MRFFWLLMVASLASAAEPAGVNTPEDAVRALEAAYVRKDLDAAVDLKDFVEEARLMLLKLDPQLASDKQMVKETAEVLEQAFRNEIRVSGFPDFKNLKCSFVAKKELAPTLTRLTEECVSPRGEKTVEDVHVTKASGKWRMVVIKG